MRPETSIYNHKYAHISQAMINSVLTIHNKDIVSTNSTDSG